MTADSEGNTLLKGVGLALVGFATFSMHDALIKSVQGIPIFQVVFFVVLFSFVPFTLMIGIEKSARSLRPRLPLLVALRCLFTLGGLLCGFYAFTHLPLAEAYSLLFSAPILITLLAIPILGERIKLIRGFAVLLGLAGVFIVLSPDNSTLSFDHIVALAGAFCVACTSVVTRKIGAREHGMTLILFPMLTNIVVSGVLTSFVYVPVPGSVLFKLACIGVLSVIGQWMMIQAYRTTEAQFVAPMQYSQMLWALIYGALIFNESVDVRILVGAAVIVLSGLLFIWRELVASVRQPVLRTRNMRMSGGPQSRSVEADSGANPGTEVEREP